MTTSKALSGEALHERAPVSAAHIAVAIVAACGVTGASPETVFESARGNIRTRTIAAAGTATALGLRAVDAARLFKVGAPTLSPSMLRDRNIETDHLLAVVEALRSSHLAPPSTPPLRARRSPAAPSGRGAAAAGATGPTHKPASASAKPAAAAVADPTPETPPEKPVFQSPAPLRAIGGEPAARTPVASRPRPTNPVRPDTATRLKPVNPQIARWSAAYVARGVSIDDLADLFDVHPDALADWLAADQRMGVAA